MTSLQESPTTVRVRSYAVIDSPPRRDLVAVAELAARICDTPMAAVNLFTDSDQYQVATVGMDPIVCSRADSMCHYVVDEPGPIVIPDARRDPRFADNAYVNGDSGGIVFYASHPLRLSTGESLGTLCVYDNIPRRITTEQAGALVTLAERVVDVLELTRRSEELIRSLTRLEAVRVELEQSNQRLAQLAGQVSHDLKTPLTSIALSLELLRDELEDGTDPATAAGLLDRAIRASGRMAGMIDDVLGFAVLGGGVEPVDVDLDTVMDEVLIDLGDALEGVAIAIDPLPVVLGDAVQLRAVLQNLLSNAAKFRSGEPRVRVRAERAAGGWRVEVADNGPGVPLEDRDRLFEPLARGDSSVEGSGIGLATCRRIVEAHGGTIGLADTPGGGTTAWFELPA